MSASEHRRLLRPEDVLYRRVMPEHWDEEGLLPAAFEDRHENLSFFTSRLKSAAADGNQFDHNGHVDIIRGQELAATWAGEARILSQRETLAH